jgi:hypothetical protein
MMNKEQLLKIAESAGFILTENKKSVDWSSNYDDALVNFGSLIVQKCISTIQMGITRDGHNTEKYLRSMKHIKNIKKHFGVE